jgi:hypothetical protein
MLLPQGMGRCHDRRASSKPQDGFDLLKIEEGFVALIRGHKPNGGNAFSPLVNNKWPCCFIPERAQRSTLAVVCPKGGTRKGEHYVGYDNPAAIPLAIKYFAMVRDRSRGHVRGDDYATACRVLDFGGSSERGGVGLTVKRSLICD